MRRALAPRDQKLGVRERDLQRRIAVPSLLYFLSAILRQSLHVCAIKNFYARYQN